MSYPSQTKMKIGFIRITRKRIWMLGLALLLFLSGAFAWVYVAFLADLPSIDAIETRMARPTTQILDRNGRLLYEIVDPNKGKQLAVTANRNSRYGVAGVPDACVQATLATEDQRFYWHPGVDPIAIARAAYQNYRSGGQIVSGGSTLTQQLARNLLLDPQERYEQSLRRKIREAWLALQLERRYTKNELLRLYLDQTYYGYFAFGLEAAAQNFFAKPAAELSRAECALLAGLVQYPTGYNPFENPDAAKLRQRTVLRLMEDAGFISPEEAKQIAAEPLQYRSNLFDIHAPHFVLYVKDLLEQQIGVDRLREGGLQIVTSLDLDLQQQAEDIVRYRLAQLNCALPTACDDTVDRNRRVENAAAVVLDAATGEILALVGSPDYFNPQIQGNVNAALSLRQPGSAIKPFTYAAALDPKWSARQGLEPLTPASIIPDLPTAFPGAIGGQSTQMDPEADGSAPYVPENYDRRFHGPVTVRQALANSYNIPAVKVLQRVGVDTLKRLAAAAGIRSFTGEYGLALTLGGGEVSLLELTTAYGIFPRQGYRLEPVAILEIRDLTRDDPSLVDRQADQTRRLPEHPEQVILPETAYLITDILSDPVARIPAFGEHSVLNLPFPAAAKTGTTTDWRDNWTVGYSTRRVVGVWVGNADNTPMQGVSGIDGAGPIWHDIMLAAHRTPPPAFPRPDDVIEKVICAPSGLLPTPNCPRVRREYFIAGTEPTRQDDQFVRIAVDMATGLRAGPDTPATRIQERVYWLLGPEYAEWMDAQGIPQPPPEQVDVQRVVSGFAPEPAGAVNEPLRQDEHQGLMLSAPTPNSMYAIHPGVPRDRQRIAVGGFATDGRDWADLRIVVDGQILSRRNNVSRLDGWWLLQPGRHTFWLEGRPTPDGEIVRSRQVSIVVE
jgi:penicillin-binding protein 1C